MCNLDLADCINKTCSWSGKSVSEDSLTTYKGHVVGFCNPDSRDKFDSAVGEFEMAIEENVEPRQDPATM